MVVCTPAKWRAQSKPMVLEPAPPMDPPERNTRSGSAPGYLASTYPIRCSTRRAVYGRTFPELRNLRWSVAHLHFERIGERLPQPRLEKRCAATPRREADLDLGGA